MKPSEVWVIVRDAQVDCDTTFELVLAYSGHDSESSFPAFRSEAAANKFLDGLVYAGLRAKKLELREE